jgi:hypothetical protein
MGAQAESESPFRSEAVAAHEAGEAQTPSVVRLSPRWLSWATWMIVAGAAAPLAFVSLVRISEYASGPAVIRPAPDGAGWTVIAALPAADRDLYRQGLPLRLELEGVRGSPVEAVLEQLGARPESAADAARSAGVGSFGAGRVIRVRAQVTRPGGEALMDGMTGTARVPVRSTPIAAWLFPWLTLASEGR